MSLDAFKTLVVQAGLTGDGRTRGERSIDAIDAFDVGNTIERRPRPFTAAAAEVAFATARAGGGHDLSWGAFLDALALVASAAGRTVGDVALRVREVKRPLASKKSAGRAPQWVPRVAYAPEPPRARGSAAADGFDVDAFARGCDDAHAEIAPSAIQTIQTHPRLEETSGLDGGGVRSPPASEGTGVGSPPSADAFFAAAETTVSRVSEETSGGTHASRFPSLASTWQNRTSNLGTLGTLGTSLVASLRASEYYRRSRG
jgi:hypothetical protein